MSWIDIEESVAALQRDRDNVRFPHFRKLKAISRRNPEFLYPFWDIFESMLNNEDVANKYFAISLIAEMVGVDQQNRFEKICGRFFKLLSHESPAVSFHIAAVSGKIARAKPHLESRITNKLLNAKSTACCNSIEMIGYHIIQAFDDYFDIISHKEKILRYVKRQLKSTNLKTRLAAREFLQKRESEMIPAGLSDIAPEIKYRRAGGTNEL